MASGAHNSQLSVQSVTQFRATNQVSLFVFFLFVRIRAEIRVRVRFRIRVGVKVGVRVRLGLRFRIGFRWRNRAFNNM